MPIGFHPKTEFKKGHKINFGKHTSPETEFKKNHLVSFAMREKMSNAKKGKKHWIYGKHHSEETKRKISEGNKGIFPTKEIREKISNAMKGRKLTKEHIKNCLRRRTPSSLEKKFQGIVDKHNLPYKYVGDGSFMIGRKNPDFINTNSEKIAVEVYANFYKQLDNRNVEKWKERRNKIFREYGWKVIYFNEVEVNEKNVLAKIKEGN